MLGGCNSSSTPTVKQVIDDSKVPVSSVGVAKNDDGSISLTKSGAVVATNPDAGNVEITVRNPVIKDGEDCTAADPCTIDFKRRCGKEDGKQLDYNDSDAVKAAFDKLEEDNKQSTAADKEMRYAGFVSVSSATIDSCDCSFKTYVKCSLDKEGIQTASGFGYFVYVNPDTAPVGSKVLVLIVKKDAAGNIIGTEWKETTIAAYEVKDGVKQAVVNVDLDALDCPSDVYLFVEENKDVEDNDVQTGATGGTGSTGSTGSTGGLGG